MSPTVGSFHTQYWENTSTVVTTVARGGYPTWQAAPMSLVLGMGLGGAEPIYAKAMVSLRWLFRLLRIIVRWSPEKRRALEKAISILDDPLYPHAVRAVKMTAHEPGFTGPAAWKGFAHKIHDRHTWAENQWRHLHACDQFERMIRADDSTITNQHRALMVELAYASYAQHAVGSTKVIT